MTSFAESTRASTLPQRIVASWNALATHFNPLAVITVAWAALTAPLVFFRGFNSDEGVAVLIARTALEDGDWVVPHTFNVRMIEHPTLVSWIIAAISWPFGEVSQISARIPIVLFLLGGCLLIYFLLRKVGASIPASLLGTGLFLACPLTIRSYVMITPDLPLAVLLFSAFCLWWGGCEKGGIGVSRWIAIGGVLALAGLLKGPQPIAYFALGVGLFIVGSRSWRQLPGLVLAGLICVIPLVAWYAAIYTTGDAGAWAHVMRVKSFNPLPGPMREIVKLVGEALPAVLLAAAFLIAQGVRGKALRPRFVAALACYAFDAPLFILFWPGGSTARYYLPMLLPLCALAGLGYDYLSAWRPQIVAPILILAGGLLAYALVYSAASPFFPMQYRRSQIDGARTAALVRMAPGPVYVWAATALNVLPYVPGRIVYVSPDEMTTLEGPAWLILPLDQAEILQARRPDKLHAAMLAGGSEQWRLLRLDK